MKRTTLFTTLAILIASCFCAHADDVADSPATKPALRTDPLTIQLKESVTLEGKLFAQKIYTSADDPKFKGETAFLPVIVMKRKLAFKFSGLDKGFLHGEPPAEPVDRIELTFEDPLLLEKHEKSEGKPARIQGFLIIDQDNRLLPVKFEVSKLEILKPAGKAKPGSPESGTQPPANALVLAPGSAMNVKQKYWSENKQFYAIFQPDGNFGVSTKDDGYKYDIVTRKKTPLGAEKLILQPDGNLVFYGPNNTYIWSIDKFITPVEKSTLNISNSGDLLLLAPDGAVLWDSSK